MFKTTTIAIAAMMGLATSAWADVAAGDTCAANLTADGKQIYAAVVAANPTLQNLRETVEEQARGLVFAGKIARAEGRDNAFAAGECVRARLQQ
jgi:NADH dehydrogenase FAD-containing subunit